jgi:hypothetical protein
MSERREQLLHATDHLIETWNRWCDDPETTFITRDFEEAVNDCLLVFSDGSIPGDLRRLWHCVGSLAEHWQAWLERNEEAPGKAPVPVGDFWSALESVAAQRAEADRPPIRHLESIAQLDAQKVGDSQICKIYGFVDAEGRPRVDILAEERAYPGKHTGPKTGWLPPYERRRRQADQQRNEAMERIREARESKIRHLTAVAPETIEELAGQGVSGNQICQMKRMDRDELEAYCRQHGLDVKWRAEGVYGMLGVTDYEPPEEPEKVIGDDGYTVTDDERFTGTDSEPAVIDEEPPTASQSAETVLARPDTTGMTLDQEIVEYAQAGFEESDIAAAVSRPDAKVTVPKVRAILKRWRKDPDAFLAAAEE